MRLAADALVSRESARFMGKANGRKAIFITGAASGMGRETARLFRDKDWFVGGFDVNPDGLARLEAELGAENCMVRRLDVRDREDYGQAVIQFAGRTGGKMDILFNNAGIGGPTAFADSPWEEVRAVLEVNLVGVLIGAHTAFPLLKATDNSLCFSTSSSAAIFGGAGVVVYSATKHAVKGMTEALSVEWRPHGIRVADALPGFIDTPLLPAEAKAATPPSGPFRLISPAEVARAVWGAYNSDKLHWYVPEELHEYDITQTANPEAMRERFASGRLFNYPD